MKITPREHWERIFTRELGDAGYDPDMKMRFWASGGVVKIYMRGYPSFIDARLIFIFDDDYLFVLREQDRSYLPWAGISHVTFVEVVDEEIEEGEKNNVS